MQMIIRTAVCLAVVSTTLFGCTRSSGSASTTASAANSPTPTSTPSIARPANGYSFSVVRELDSQKNAESVTPGSWESDLVLSTRQTPLPDDATVHDLTDSGKFLISRAKTVVKNGEAVLQPATISLWPGSGSDARALDSAADRSGPVTQPINARMHGVDATWAETTSTDLFRQDWRIKFFDSKSATTRLIADSARVFPGARDLRPAPGNTIPTLSADQNIYWEAAAPDPKEPLGYTAVIMGRDAAAKNPVKTVVRKASNPVIVGSTLFYSRLDDVSPQTPQKTLEIRARTPEGTDRLMVRAPLLGDQQLLHLTATSTHLAWIVGDTDREAEPSADSSEGCSGEPSEGCSLYVMRQNTNQATRVQLHSFSALTTLSPTFVGWGSNGSAGDSGQYVMDLATARLWRLADVPGCSRVFFAGDFASWFTDQEGGWCLGRITVRFRPPT